MRAWLAVVFLVACAARAQAPIEPPPLAPDDDETYRALRERLARDPRTGAPADTIAALLELLDDDMRGNFTLVYASRSPERDIDPLHPRAIAFTPDARLVLAFTGDPAGAHRDVLDVIRFRDAARAWQLERFVLPAAARRDPALAALARDNGRANPLECRRCHGSDPRPIFESYFVWPGFYGSIRDRLAGDELAAYRAFLARKDGVYRALRFPPGSPVAPYTIDPDVGEAIALAPNLRFGIALVELDRKRIARRIEASPRYARYRDKLLAGLLGCERLPIDDMDRARVRAALAAEDRDKLDRAGVVDPKRRAAFAMAELLDVDNLAALDYVARALDVDRADWSMELEPGAFARFDGILDGDVGARSFYFTHDLAFELLADLAASDARVAPLFATRPYALLGRTGTRLDLPRAIAGCALFAARGKDVAWPVLRAPPPRVAFRCARCHEPGGEAPPIPFESPPRLAALLAARPGLRGAIAARVAPHAHRRMPLDDRALDRDERAALLAYVDAAASGGAPVAAPSGANVPAAHAAIPLP